MNKALENRRARLEYRRALAEMILTVHNPEAAKSKARRKLLALCRKILAEPLPAELAPPGTSAGGE